MSQHLKHSFSATRLEIKVHARTDVGKVRAKNEDSLMTMEIQLDGSLSCTRLGLYAVADGIGGHKFGEIASRRSLKALTSTILEELPSFDHDNNDVVIEREVVSEVLIKAVKNINQQIYAHNYLNGCDLGTTLVATLIINNTAFIANIGDSRAYLFSGAKLKQITVDHSLVSEMVAAGEIAPNEIYTHPKRNIITRCLGIHKDVEVDLFVEELISNDSILICSDGLWEMVEDDNIITTLADTKSAKAACNRLMHLANDNGGVDNISIIVIKVV